jgi:phosphatidylglycerol:prolipoprotein diacylglycerol transferase
MLPELFHIPGTHIPIFGYGLMLVAAFFGFMCVVKYLARRSRLDPELFVNVTFLCLIFGIIGARASHVLENLSDYTNQGFFQNLLHMANLQEGGLTLYGGFLLATPIAMGYAIYKKVPLRLGMDIVAVGLLVALGFGRIGCYLNGCCYGADCAWGVRFPYHSIAYMDQVERGEIQPPAALQRVDADGRVRLLSKEEVARDPHLAEIAAQNRANPVLPTELFSSFNAFLLGALLFAYFTVPHAPGRVFALALVLAGGTRFLLEMIRVEPPVDPAVFGNLSIAQVTGVGLVAAGVALWIVYGRYGRGEAVQVQQVEGVAA